MTFVFNLPSFTQYINAQLPRYLPNPQQEPQRLHQAMRYSVMNGGKRLRPYLVFLTGHMLGATNEQLLPAAIAIELVHCYSLVHDDLPSMDNDDLRRGLPTCHKAFDEATAILVGDALQAQALTTIVTAAGNGLSQRQTIRMLHVLTHAMGSRGMAGGQALDIASAAQTISLNQLNTIHEMKTGALLQASLELGAISANCEDEQTLTTLRQFARLVGLAYQIQDDLLDVEATAEALGKTAGKDAKRGQPTYASMLERHDAYAMLETLLTQAHQTLAQLSVPSDLLASFLTLMESRRS